MAINKEKSLLYIVQLPYTYPPIPFGPPIRVSSVKDIPKETFSTQKTKTRKYFYLN